jgi:hypothetical protein
MGSPSVSGSGADGLVPPNAIDAAGTVQLVPGIYQSITVSGGRVNLGPGIYVLSPSSGTPYALDVTGGTFTGTGVMFYNTGSDFVPGTGYPDYTDAGLYDPGPSGMNAPAASGEFQGLFAGIRLDTSENNTIRLSPMTSNGGVFNGTLLYQRRANRQSITLRGGGLSLSGTVYAKWAPLMVRVGGGEPVQLVVGSLQVSGNDTLTLSTPGSVTKAREVFLVE